MMLQIVDLATIITKYSSDLTCTILIKVGSENVIYLMNFMRRKIITIVFQHFLFTLVILFKSSIT